MSVGIRVMTWNIAYCTLDGGLDAVVANIRGRNPDLVCLQEVGIGGSLASDIDQPLELATRTGLPYRAFGRDGVYDGGDVGQAVLSRFPLGPIGTYQFAARSSDQHGWAEGTILKTSAVIHRLTHHIFTAHPRLDHNIIACANLVKQLVESLASAEAVLLGADMNIGPEGDAIGTLRSVLTDTWTANPDVTDEFCPGGLIDYVMCRGPYDILPVQHRCPGQSEGSFPSDHPWHLATLVDTRTDPPRCEEIRVSIRDKRAEIDLLQQAKAGLNPRDPADRAEINAINRQIDGLRAEISTLEQESEGIPCLSTAWWTP